MQRGRVSKGFSRSTRTMQCWEGESSAPSIAMKYSLSLWREKSVEQPKKQSGVVSTLLIVITSQMTVATGNSNTFVFHEQKLRKAYRKIGA